MKKIYLLSVIVSLAYPGNYLLGSDITIENVRVVNRGDVLSTPVSVIFDIRWKNSWNNKKNHDAAWVFMKLGGFWLSRGNV